MKNNVTDGLNDILNIDQELIEVIEPVARRQVPDDIASDYDFARQNLYDVIGKGNEALDYLLELAKASEHPRAFEVVGQLTKTLIDANTNLLDIQKKVKELTKTDSPQNVTNALFVGSTSELQKLLKGGHE
jgi:hypothetical protein|tara:strand:- start:1180 stop:1572 length:393 start_codon:yes stop_codon:yes gene_type:complete